jgi:glycosyltransferase involved in cell wall biosynthesis
MLLKLTSRMDRTRFHNRVVSLMKPSPGFVRQFVDAGISVTNFGLTRGLHAPMALAKLSRELLAYRPHIVQGWTYAGNIAAQIATALSLPRVPVLWSIRHSADEIISESPFTRALIRFGAPLSRLPSKVIYCAELSARQHEALGYRKDRTVVIPNGFDTDRFAPSAAAYAQLRHALSLSDAVRIIGIVGRYHPMKDHHGFLVAAAEVARALTDVQFVMVGRKLENSNAELMEVVDRLGLRQRVHLLGQRSDVPKLMAGFDLFCMSSAYGESFPNVLGEAMSCGVPCVATAVGAAAEIVDGAGENVPPKNTRALAAAMLRLLTLPPSSLKALGEQGRARIVENYSLPAVVRQYEALYTAFRQQGA